MSTCSRSFTYKTTEKKLWEQEGYGWPDTSQPPDSHSSTPKELVDSYSTCPPPDTSEPEGVPWWVCPDGTTYLELGPEVKCEHTYCTTTVKHWMTIDPEIPHVKTYHTEETKTTIYTTEQVVTWVCFPSSILSALKDHFPYSPPAPQPRHA
jgi:hypothetical protein